MDEALTSHLEDATKEADRLRDSVDRDNSRDGNVARALDMIDQLEDAQAFVSRAGQRISNIIGND